MVDVVALKAFWGCLYPFELKVLIRILFQFPTFLILFNDSLVTSRNKFGVR